MKKSFIKSENKIHILIFIITILIAISPLISKSCVDGHDVGYHLLRIESLKQGILIGKPFLKVNTLFMGDAGYASSMFYPDLFIYIPALLRVLGVNINASYHIFVGVIFILCYISTFYCAAKMGNSKYIGTIAAVLLTLCPYHMDDMIVRAACGEYSAFVFAPFVIYGVYNILCENMSKPWVFALGFGGLILTHPATLFLNVVFTAVVFVLYIKRFISNPKLILKVLITTIITMAMTAFQWAPMLEQMMSAKFGVEAGDMDMLYGALQFRHIFSLEFPTMGMIFLAIALLRILIKREADDELLKYADILLLAGFVTAIGTADVWPWDKLGRILQFMQFPWRMFAISSVLFAFADVIIVVYFIKKMCGVGGSMECDAKKNAAILELVSVVVLVVSSCFAIAHYNVLNVPMDKNGQAYYDYGTSYYDFKPYTAYIIGGEWLPSTVTDSEAVIELSEHMLLDNGAEVEFTRHRASVISEIPTGNAYVDVPFIYYKGYKAILTDENGAKKNLRVTSEGIDGFCRVYTDGNGGHLQVYYGGTTVIKASAVISILTLLGYCLYVIYIHRKSN